jgi:hypothetical protein
MAMTEHDFEVWARLRRMGGVRFVLGVGVLGFGVPLGAFMSLFFPAVVWLIDGDRLPPWFFALFAALSLFGGLAFGCWQWYTSEKAYRQWRSTLCDEMWGESAS